MIKKIISLVILLALLLTACSESSDATTAALDAKNGENVATEQIDTEILEESAQPSQSQGTSGEANDSEISSEEILNGETEDQSPEGAEGTSENEPVQTTEGTTENEPTQTTGGATEIVEVRIYEEHLAALTLFALSMEYPDFVLQGIYSGTSVSIENKMSSAGIYAMFESGGSSLIAHIYPIDAERTQPGTTDLYAAELGFAAFDFVESRDNSYSEISQDVYASLLAELSSISIFSH